MDTAVSRALLLRAGAGEVAETIRLYAPGPVLAFGRRDVLSAGYPEAVEAARAAGFVPVERLAGGRAAVFHEGTIAFAWTIPDPDPTSRTTARFVDLAATVVAALAFLGVDARIGEVAGEYCPGEYSVNARGSVKLMGVGQRLARRAAHVGGVIVVSGPERIRRVLEPVYAALGLEWDPATVGAVDREAPGVTVGVVISAVLAALGARHDLIPGRLDPATVSLARTLAPEHAVRHLGGDGACR